MSNYQSDTKLQVIVVNGEHVVTETGPVIKTVDYRVRWFVCPANISQAGPPVQYKVIDY
jgi:hypothetical protein